MNIVACVCLIFVFFIVLGSNKFMVKDIKETQEQPINKLIPFAISIYDGGFGPGSALMNITYYLKNQYIYIKAVELTRIITFSSCTGAFLFYYFTGIVNWGIAIPVSIGSIVGSFLGLKIIPYIKTKWIQVLLPIIFFLLIVQVVSDLLT
ncbi:putative membrane protein YfcA [Lysinibacillus parviboronicapiens]|uniref:Probable membrane transporter protein n=1 Tax=Lysinibacillus parviboronicapiens TaxID=436516 RepID=A0ABV2PJF9_9BACI